MADDSQLAEQPSNGICGVIRCHSPTQFIDTQFFFLHFFYTPFAFVVLLLCVPSLPTGRAISPLAPWNLMNISQSTEETPREYRFMKQFVVSNDKDKQRQRTRFNLWSKREREEEATQKRFKQSSKKECCFVFIFEIYLNIGIFIGAWFFFLQLIRIARCVRAALATRWRRGDSFSSPWTNRLWIAQEERNVQ